MIIISGMQPGLSGVGRVMTGLVKDASEKEADNVRFIFGGSGGLSIPDTLKKGRVLTALKIPLKRRALVKSLDSALDDKTVIDEKTAVLIHHQTLGAKWCMEFIERRRHPTWLCLMDSGFFCLRSYNYIPGEEGSCLRCVGGEFGNAEKYSCKPFPVPDDAAMEFLERLRGYATLKRVKFLAQNKGQASLVKTHFGKDAVVKINGLWAEDWNEIVGYGAMEKSRSSATRPLDVVFHGAPVAAKGAEWAIELAGRCPDVSFLFPFEAPDRQLPGNCVFESMTWEEGLKEKVRAARLVLVPSLWSAPIEGALVKSIALARGVLVVENKSTFSSEIPRDVVRTLPADIEQASNGLKDALRSGWTPDEKKRDAWLKAFIAANRGLLGRLQELQESDLSRQNGG